MLLFWALVVVFDVDDTDRACGELGIVSQATVNKRVDQLFISTAARRT